MKRLLLALLCATGCKSAAPAEQTAAKAVRCEPAVALAMAETVKLRGTIAPLPDRDALVAPQVAGRIVTLLAREGDSVDAGQPLARIDDGPLIDDAKAAEAAFARTEAERRNAATTLERVKRVFDHGIAARQELDDATARSESAAAAASEAEAALQRTRRQVERATVKSPLGGVIVKLIRKPGELVDGTPATAVMEVADPSRLELVADAAVADLVRLHSGQSATVSVAALPNAQWVGKVAAVSPAVDRATGLGVARIELTLESGKPRPPIGTLASADVALAAPTEQIAVPVAALRAAAGDQAEVVVCEAKASVRRVTRGATVSGQVAVTGLDAGEQVVVEPVLGIADGDALEPRGAAEK
ncbi:MAG: efflux RND transporter periplasmic adaptor subunit [Myxococcaceae bacterium]